MKHNQRNKEHGVTLIEMMLVAAVIAMFFTMLIGYTQQRTRSSQIDRASQQMQQILNAGLSYYISQGRWPVNLAELQAPTAYVPANITSPWNAPYVLTPMPSGLPPEQQILLQVSLTLPAALSAKNAISAVIANKVPYGVSTPGVGAAPAVVTASVNLPGQDLNNATGVNFAGTYHTGTCVPVPVCPASDVNGNAMTPQIMVAPTSVSGTNDAGQPTVYPISSLTASATAPAASPAACTATGTTDCGGTLPPSGMYWRVCLTIVTTKGPVVLDSTTAQWAVVMAMTRCSIVGEPAGNGGSFGP